VTSPLRLHDDHRLWAVADSPMGDVPHRLAGTQVPGDGGSPDRYDIDRAFSLSPTVAAEQLGGTASLVVR
jgi:hypothetical protein